MLAFSLAPHDAITQLDTLVASARLPSRDAERCRRLANSLRRPARICMLGRDKIHIAGVVTAMLEMPDLSLGALPAAVELRFGPTLRTNATFEDGTSISQPCWPTQSLLQKDPVFLQIDLPSERLRSMSWLVLALEADPAMHRPALSWATSKCEIAVWCTPSFDATDLRVWNSAPERLTQHAYLLETRPDPALRRDAAVATFTQVFVSETTGERGGKPDVTPLLDRLTADIAEARIADLDMVQLFLHRLGHLVPALRAEPEVESGAESGPMPEAPRGGRLPTHPTQDLRAVLSEPLLYLMRRTREMAEALDLMEAEDWVPLVLSHCVDTTEALRERAEGWPQDEPMIEGLQALIDEICDITTLLQIEGKADQAHDAAALLYQVRAAFERALGWEDEPHEP